ncbi:YbaK/EbsC family protein [Frankia sp. AvcI1]|uniref:YbaK/EbsC family protein n=1 Tax=Frankia sp. AvcI1 TaxID=573496 RepID=UPI000A5A4F87|nr:YbaK/EbsC family protein [Frankia sp. AvcI1]
MTQTGTEPQTGAETTGPDFAELPPRSRLVAEALHAAGAEQAARAIRELPDSARTAAEAAAAVGCEVGAIANSLVFVTEAAQPVLVLTSGSHRVDTDALAPRLGVAALSRASAAQVREATGQAIGGVAPVGHPAPLRTVVDVTLADHPRIWAAAGTPHTVFPTTYEELVRVTDGTPLPVTAD